MLNLSPFGAVHTAIGLVAVAAGAVALVRRGAIDVESTVGRCFLWATVLTCITGFFIFRHGGFGPPHALGVLTLVVLAPATWVQRRAHDRGTVSVPGTVGLTFAFFLHFIPGATETFTRLPVGDPWFSGPDDPALQALVGALFALFVVGAVWQVLHLRAAAAASPAMRARGVLR